MLIKKSNALHPDQTVNRPRFGVCIKKTDYRATQEDRVSLFLRQIKLSRVNCSVKANKICLTCF